MDLLVVIAAFNVYQRIIAQAMALVTKREHALVRMDLVGATVLSKTSIILLRPRQHNFRSTMSSLDQ